MSLPMHLSMHLPMSLSMTTPLELKAPTTTTSTSILLHSHLLQPVCHLVGLLVRSPTNEARPTLLKSTAHASCGDPHASLLASHASLLSSHINLTSTASHPPSPGSRWTSMLFRRARSKDVPEARIMSASASAGEVFVLLDILES